MFCYYFPDYSFLTFFWRDKCFLHPFSINAENYVTLSFARIFWHSILCPEFVRVAERTNSEESQRCCCGTRQHGKAEWNCRSMSVCGQSQSVELESTLERHKKISYLFQAFFLMIWNHNWLTLVKLYKSNFVALKGLSIPV